MKTLRQLCVPRQSVFDRHRRDVVLDLTDLIEDCIKASDFFEENYLTDGMKRLLQEAFRRFAGRSDQGVFVLTQAMGGGKTHNMVALGLLAKHPELRRRVMGDLDDTAHTSTPVRVVAFSGREEAPLGIWGAIAGQLGKREQFKDYYSPLSAPGQSTWVDLLRGEPLLILLDELPPYFENARSKPIGNSDLSVVTTTALSNLLVAVGKPGLSNVCVVISDLKATYEDGSNRINRALDNFANEVGRSALMLEPVGLNTDEIYHILRKRLFVQLPTEADVDVVVKAYVQAVRDAKQMDITSASPEKFAQLLKASYPFHFAIRDLYARFRENPGFQQTRGLIRFMRVVVSRLFEDGGRADRLALIHAHDVDLNDRETKAQITQINPTLDNAISHDIASNGQAIAEIMDARLSGTDAQDACKLLLVASLASVPDAVLGLSLSEVASYLCAPGRDLSSLPKDILAELNTRAWYLHANRDGKLYFKNVQNLVAKLKTTAEAYNRESSLRELRTFMERAFAPSQLKDCYQEVLVFPAVDEIEIMPDRVSLIVCEPSPGGGLHPDLRRFYEDLTYPNRILFLSGAHGSLETLLETAAELKAIDFILEEMNAERVPEGDPQRAAATDMCDKITLRLLSATRETFTTLTYPHGDKLMHADFQMQFTDNHYNGEKQIRETLKAKQKFTEDVASETFRKKCEQRLFTQKAMPWSEVKKRAATNPQWQWHRMDALDALKNDLVRKDQWREQGNYVEKPPFPKPHTDVRIQEVQRDDRTGTAILKLTPVHGDTLYYEVGGDATPASATVTDPRHFETRDLTVSFLCVDSKGEHDTGEPVTWQNRITIQSRTYQSGNDRMVELRATPTAPIRYTTDGSNPNLSGAVYEGPFVLPKHASVVLVGAETAGLVAEQHRLDVDAEGSDTVKIDPERPAIWKHKHKSETTQDTYTLLGQLKRFQASILGSQVSMVAGPHWLEFTSDDQLALDIATLEAAVESLREILPDGQITLETFALRFPNGRQLLAWVEDARTELQPEEVEQL